ncbi:MAG: hypothetical protein Q8Q81_14010 [Oxalobacteraceae bacterium]|nr:hypothetical protein [Oxalobacteraceae bacterium]
MGVFFARHVHDWNDGGWIRFLYGQRAIGVCFDRIESWNPEDYSTGAARTAIRYLCELDKGQPEDKGEPDDYVFASYTFDGRLHVLSGQPKQGSKRFLREMENLPGDDRPVPSLKVLLLENVKLVTRDEFPLVYLLPPRMTTFVRWGSCERVAMPWLRGEPVNLIDPDAYLPSSIEVACEEYLREKKLLTRKVFQTGGTLADFDIIGSGPRGAVLVQVKNGGGRGLIRRAAERMVDENEATPSTRVLFCRENAMPIHSIRGIEVIAIEDVLKSLNESFGSDYLRMLQAARYV